SVLKYTSPRLLMPPKHRRSPDECSRAVRPSQEARCLPEENRRASTIIALSALAASEGAVQRDARAEAEKLITLCSCNSAAPSTGPLLFQLPQQRPRSPSHAVR